MKAHPIIPINQLSPPKITLDQTLAELNEASRIQSLYAMTISRQATNLAIEALLFIKMARVTPEGLVPPLFNGEKR